MQWIFNGIKRFIAAPTYDNRLFAGKMCRNFEKRRYKRFRNGNIKPFWIMSNDVLRKKMYTFCIGTKKCAQNIWNKRYNLLTMRLAIWAQNILHRLVCSLGSLKCHFSAHFAVDFRWNLHHLSIIGLYVCETCTGNQSDEAKYRRQQQANVHYKKPWIACVMFA